jgi:hypothetical protein
MSWLNCLDILLELVLGRRWRDDCCRLRRTRLLARIVCESGMALVWVLQRYALCRRLLSFLVGVVLSLVCRRVSDARVCWRWLFADMQATHLLVDWVLRRYVEWHIVWRRREVLVWSLGQWTLWW